MESSPKCTSGVLTVHVRLNLEETLMVYGSLRAEAYTVEAHYEVLRGVILELS